MHKHPITYTNFNNETRSKDLYFNLSEAELTKLQKDYLDEGGIQVVMNAAIDSGDTRQILDFFELLVRRSYGIKSADGEVFDKTEKIWNDFENSAFYSDLYMSFFQDEGAVGQAFIRAVMPANLIAKAEANVRGEGDLAQAAQAAQQFKPDSRTLFEQSRNNLQDHIQKIDNNNAQAEPATTNVFQQPTAQEQTIGQEAGWGTPQDNRYEPANQPQAPSFGGVPETPTHRLPDHDVSITNSPELSQAEYAQRQAEQAANQQHIARPPHESGPGYNAGQ